MKATFLSIVSDNWVTGSLRLSNLENAYKALNVQLSFKQYVINYICELYKCKVKTATSVYNYIIKNRLSNK